MSSSSAPLSTPPLKARLFCMVYESMLLFGVVFIGGWLFSTLLQQRHALNMRNELQVWLFIVLGFYFTWFWTHGGQTLAMKTWRIKLISTNGARASLQQAVLRYLLVWLWFLPGLAMARLLEAKGWMLVLLPTLNCIIWALAVFLHPERQFLHDRIAKTKLVLLPAKLKSAASNKI